MPVVAAKPSRPHRSHLAWSFQHGAGGGILLKRNLFGYLQPSLSCGGARGAVVSSQHFGSFLQMLVFSFLLLSLPFCKYSNHLDK